MAEGKAHDTIEWGDKQPQRRSWFARLTAEAPPDEGDESVRARLNYPALVLTVLGFLAVLAGQYLPWLHVNLNALGFGQDASRTTDLSFTALYALPALTYGLSVLLTLAGAATMLTVTSPVLGASSPAATFSSVLLPQPVGPTTETNSPAPTSRLTSRTAV